MVGRTLENRYTITARLGSGSMGTVYRAKQHAMGREVAIKILRGDRAIDDSAKARFLREARANSLLASPNTVTVFDFGQSDHGELYLAMELLEGESLGQRLSRVGRLPIPVAVDAARQALRSLSEAHAKGIIHRDLKPANLFFARVLTSAASASSPSDGHEEIVKVLDFGIAKMMPNGEAAPIAEMDAVETQVGTVFGTPRYMSPEQAQGKPLDPRTDLYSLGVIIYQMLTGRPPFTDTDAVVVMARHIKSVPKRPNEAVPEANIPKELEDVVMRSLSKVPEERQASADIFAGELLAALEAQGATTSGVRASITNAAGIRVPDSMRPPPVSLPPPPKSARSGLSIRRDRGDLRRRPRARRKRRLLRPAPAKTQRAAAAKRRGVRVRRSAATKRRRSRPRRAARARTPTDHDGGRIGVRATNREAPARPPPPPARSRVDRRHGAHPSPASERNLELRRLRVSRGRRDAEREGSAAKPQRARRRARGISRKSAKKRRIN